MSNKAFDLNHHASVHILWNLIFVFTYCQILCKIEHKFSCPDACTGNLCCYELSGVQDNLEEEQVERMRSAN